ncbi:MAG TPA: ABC transporter permease [Anaerolineales bacterium]|nr:ABC transporter permease [Anaerolineales bacterium]
MNWQTIPPLIQKDLTIFFRNRFYTFITIVALVAYIGVYYAMPNSVDEIIEVGLYAPSTSAEVTKMLDDDGISFQLFESEAALKQAILDEEIGSGIAFPENLFPDVAAGRKPTVNIYVPSDVDNDIKDAMLVIVEAMTLTLTGRSLNIEANEVILGRDMAGEQIPLRDRMLPFFAIIVLMFETMGLASLLAEEIQAGTIRALLISPMSTRELFAAKGVVSVSMVLFQSVVLMTAVGAMRYEPLIILTTLFLGSLLVTGIGFLMGAAGKDMLSVMAWGVLAMILLGVPSFGVLFPGTMTAWAKLIPSYYLVDTVHQVINFGAGWSQVSNNLLLLLVWSIGLLLIGAAVLKRKFA